MPGWAVIGAERHRHGFVLLAILLALVAPWMPDISLAQQFWIILVPVLVFGMAHGGADPIIMGDLKRLRGLGNAMAFGGYCVLMLLAIAVIWWQPEIALAAFLVMSAAHFARTDMPFLPPGAPRLVGWLSGTVAIVGPIAGHPEQVAVLFAWLLQHEASAFVPPLQLTGYVLISLWIVLLGIAVAATRQGHRVAVLIELGTLASVSLLLPPLLAFAFYFCGVHSVRHFIMLMMSLRARQADVSIGRLARLAAPATLVAIGLGAGAWWLLHNMHPAQDMAWLADGVRVIFWGLAVLTVPHALLVLLWPSPAFSRSH